MKPGFIDTHCHPYLEASAAERDAVIDRAFVDGAEALVLVGIDAATNRQVLDIALGRDRCYTALGHHPHSAHVDSDAFESGIEALLADPRNRARTVALGEVGLDYFKSEASRDVQIRVFERAVELAARLGLPLVVHSRDAFEDTIRILEAGRKRHPGLRALFHCYTYGERELERVLAAGLSVSFSGIVTFKNALDVQRAARRVDPASYVIETDAPYLAPAPHRGERNEPARVRLVAAKIAELRGEPVERVLADTVRNARTFFGLPAA